MKKLVSLLLTSCCLLWSAAAFAEQNTTVLKQNLTLGHANAELPYIDGTAEAVMEKMANEVIMNKARALAKRMGNSGEVRYKVTLNRPSLVSAVLEASCNGRVIYDSVNVDLTTGREFGINDFFVDDDTIKGLFDKKEEVVFAEKGILQRSSKNGPFDKLLPYEDILASVRVGEAGRIFQIARLTANATGKTLKLKAGSLIATKLESNPSTGYSWLLQETPAVKDRIVKIGSSFIMPPSTDTRVGTPGTEIAMYNVKAPGTYDFVLEYRRPWEKVVIQSVRVRVIAE